MSKPTDLTPMTVDKLRRMNRSQLMRLSDAGDPAAVEHLALRARGEVAVRGVLAHLGHRYTGTSGWWITAYVTPQRKLGYVNIAHGVAIETDVTLDADVVEAATVPGQGTGPQVSGAAAWAAPDPGEAHHASAPPGWVQLAVDIRDLRGPAEPVAARAYVVAWGLATCYDRPGEPGWSALDGSGPDVDPWDWPVTATTAGMRRVADQALDEIARDFAGRVPEAAAALPDLQAARDAVWRAGGGRWRGYTASSAVHHVLGTTGTAGAFRALLDSAGVRRLDALRCTGDVTYRSLDHIAVLVSRVLADRLDPVAELLAGHLGPLAVEGRPTPAWWTLTRQVEKLLPILGEELLSGTATRARAAADAAEAAYLADGPIHALGRRVIP